MKNKILIGIGIVVAFLVGIGIGSSGGSSESSSAAPVTVTAAPVTMTQLAPAPTERAAPPPVTTAPTQDTIGEGTFEVGTDVKPGKYKSAGPSGAGCYYARLKNNDGALGDILDNNISNGPSTVTIKESDGYFETNGCQTWRKV